VTDDNNGGAVFVDPSNVTVNDLHQPGMDPGKWLVQYDD
ncbi:uncharacterized protein METZ01_LOCUS136547, partial [marine metagenome]